MRTDHVCDVQLPPPSRRNLSRTSLDPKVSPSRLDLLPTTLSMSHTTAASSLPPVDRLTSLPPELFEHILDIVHVQAPRAKLGLVSKAFLYYTRRRLLTRLTITEVGRLVKFCNYLIDYPQIGSFVQSLEIKFTKFPFTTIAMTEVELLKLLQALVSLTSLEIVNFSRLTRLILQPPSNKTLLPSLRELQIEERLCRDWENPFDPIYWTNLHRYPELFNLRIDLHEDVSLTVNGGYKKNTLPLDREIQDLTVCAPIRTNPAFSDFLAHFGKLSSLHLAPTSSAPIYDALNRIPYPLRLRFLALDLQSLSTTELASTFLRFPNIRELSFVQGTCTLAVLALLPTLFNLQTVSLEYPTKLSTDDLQAFLETCSSSFTIYLDNISRKRRRRYVSFYSSDEEYEGDDGYREIGWGQNFTKQGMRKCIEVAKSLALRLEGKVVRDSLEGTE